VFLIVGVYAQYCRVQAFNDIFGRPTGPVRPAYSNQLQSLRPSPSMRMQAPLPYAPGGPRPQSSYAPIGLAYPPPPPQQGQQQPQQQQMQMGYSGGHPSYQTVQQQQQAAGPPAQQQQLQGGQFYHTSESGHVLPSPPPPPQGPAFRALNSADSNGNGTSNNSTGPSPGQRTPAVAYSASYMSQQQQYGAAGGGHQPPRLPSFDAGDDFDWFDSNKTIASGSGSGNATGIVQEGPPGSASSGRHPSNNGVPYINRPLSRSSSKAPIDGSMSELHITTPTPPLSSGSTRPPYSANSQGSSRRSFTSSSSMSTSTPDYASDQYNYPARDSPSSGMSGSSGPNAGLLHDVHSQQFAGKSTLIVNKLYDLANPRLLVWSPQLIQITYATQGRARRVLLPHKASTLAHL